MNEFNDSRCGLREIDWRTPLTLTASTPTNLGPNLESMNIEVNEHAE